MGPVGAHPEITGLSATWYRTS